jgi:hypothetical protein
MNPRAVVLPLAVLVVGAGIGLWFRGRSPAVGPGPADGKKEGEAAVRGEAAAGKPSEKYHPEPVRAMQAPKTEKVPARVHTPKAFYVFPSVPATPVARVLVQEGAAVKKGDVLLEFLDAGWTRELAAAEKAGDAPRVEAARKALGSLGTRSPEDGIVYSVAARVGERPLLTKGEPLPLVTLFDWRQLSYEGTAPASLADLLKPGTAVLVTAGKDVPVQARVEKADPPAADGGVHLLVRPTAPPSSVPDPEQDAEILVVVGTREVLTVPISSIRNTDGRPMVLVYRVTGELMPRSVVLGLLLPGSLIEVSGVKVGESVAVPDRR